jgi:hypothetical protein
MEANFSVVVRLVRTNLEGAKVEITSSNADRPTITELTDRSGRARIRKLSPGDYWINVSYLGVSAGGQCFHVRAESSSAARSALRYRWGDYAMPMRSIGGSLQEWQPGTGGTPIWNLAHGQTAQIAGATVVLENALTREVLRSESDLMGLFRFDLVPDGTYVLHIEGGKTARAYAATDMIVPVSHTASRESVVLTLREDGCGIFTFAPQWR